MEDLECQRPKFTALVNSSHNHTQGEAPEVQEVLKRYSSLEERWHKMEERVKEMCEKSKPWLELTEQFDELCVFVEGLERKVKEGEEKVNNMKEEDGGDLSDRIVEFKVRFCCCDMLAKYTLNSPQIGQCTCRGCTDD